jgi:hypothetical protein
MGGDSLGAIFWALDDDLVMHVQHHIIKLTQRMTQNVMSSGLGDVLTSQATP